MAMKTRMIQAEGHLIDSGILSKILNTILGDGGDYRITSFKVGKTPDEISLVEIELKGADEALLEVLSRKLTPFGVFEKAVPSALFGMVDKDSHAPETFYSSTNQRTEVYVDGKWMPVDDQRMDAAIVREPKTGRLVCRKIRDLKTGDHVVCTSDSVRVFPVEVERSESELRTGGFGFMTGEVSSERSVDTAVKKTAALMRNIRKRGGKIVVVCGPVVVHTGGVDALASLVRSGYIQGFLGGNAVAVHDLEYRFFGTSLGVSLTTGRVSEHGHSHHMRSINRIYGCGSIQAAIGMGVLGEGLMYEIVKSGIPYCLAGSIRDDGPLPETVNDMLEAQRQYAHIIEGADLIIMLSTMLHSIGTGNMSPAWVKTICVDINPAVVTKLADRGSSQAIGIVSDVGLFLRALEAQLA
ncbi:MAG: TIGR00300 family protein [Spirochaetae bacterium HGW-Spirochaetae-4]|jgi:lysine-ketoglutarate reductase/saccharopine dehydrogenase-like protein (TIGR00300 family)|nr:MAG: TIGR00300 family protein [Spirochaetae bacterium HGW-Spirochaetae-4]